MASAGNQTTGPFSDAPNVGYCLDCWRFLDVLGAAIREEPPLRRCPTASESAQLGASSFNHPENQPGPFFRRTVPRRAGRIRQGMPRPCGTGWHVEPMMSLDRNHIGTIPGEHCSSNGPSLLLYFLHLDNEQPTFR